MLGSLLLGVIGLAELLAPRRVVDLWFDLATTGDGSEPRPWVYTAARLEGLLVLLWLLSRRRGETSDT
jgi:hypothetical protein